jgi:mannose-6-phosphate isomerase-like protein (cupin superfamily)
MRIPKGKSMNIKTKRDDMNCATEMRQHDLIATQASVAAALVLLSVAGVGCYQAATAKQPDLPKQSYERQPEQPFNPSDYVFKPNQMTSFYDVPGEFGHAMEGADYGFKSLSFIVTETQPGGGPPLHVHDCEEAHVLLEGRASYVLGDQRFTVEGPYVVKIPAGVPHTFINAGSKPLRLIGVLPMGHIQWKELGPNPLVKKP